MFVVCLALMLFNSKSNLFICTTFEWSLLQTTCSVKCFICFSSNCAPLCRRGSCSRVVRVSMPIPGQKHAAHVVNNLLMAPVQLPRHVKRLWGPCATLPLPFFFLLSPPPSIGLSEYLTSEFYSFQFNSVEHSANVCQCVCVCQFVSLCVWTCVGVCVCVFAVHLSASHSASRGSPLTGAQCSRSTCGRQIDKATATTMAKCREQRRQGNKRERERERETWLGMGTELTSKREQQNQKIAN